MAPARVPTWLWVYERYDARIPQDFLAVGAKSGVAGPNNRRWVVSATVAAVDDWKRHTALGRKMTPKLAPIPATGGSRKEVARSGPYQACGCESQPQHELWIRFRTMACPVSPQKLRPSGRMKPGFGDGHARWSGIQCRS